MSELSHTNKDKYHMIYMWNRKKTEPIETGQNGAQQGLEAGGALGGCWSKCKNLGLKVE